MPGPETKAKFTDVSPPDMLVCEFLHVRVMCVNTKEYETSLLTERLNTHYQLNVNGDNV